MLRIICISGLAACALSSAAAAETRNFDLAPFEAIEVSAGLKLVATAGRKQTIEVQTDEGDFSDFEIEVEDGVLYLSREWNRLRWHQKKADYKVIVTAPKIEALEASSGSHSTLEEIDARRFNADLSSGSFAVISGRSDNCTVDISSGANLDARGLVCGSANIDVSSGGHGEITVMKALVGDASSGGHVAVFGSPERVNIDRSSGGRIKIKSPVTANRDD
ncbi:head GIN domain-containing protein [Hyphococcus sp.]|jgi:hypothetical protein|uniref:head GIN domain-containing protein n=1 Tax=Hyphococcus sp. TaxID=2038636 RepID=UPI003D0F8023